MSFEDLEIHIQLHWTCAKIEMSSRMMLIIIVNNNDNKDDTLYYLKL